MTSRSEYSPRHRRADKVGPAPWRATGGRRAAAADAGFGPRSIALLAVLAVVAVGAWVPFYLARSSSDELRTKADVAAGQASESAPDADTVPPAATPAPPSASAAAAQRRAVAARRAAASKTAAARRSRAATPSRSAAPARKAPAAPDLGSMTENAKVVALVNVERAKADCGAVHSDSRLDAAALGHSQDMIARNYFDHTTPDGVSPWDRAKAAGYTQPTGENIAMGQTDAAAVMQAWMTSPGHRANILNCDSKAIGMGLARDSGGSPYWTQMFGAV